VHRLVLVLEHSPHAPLNRHAGASGSVQSLSDVHPVHEPVPVLQTGWGPEQSASLVWEHCAHVPFV
jgi:hypothetical protein